MISQKDKIYIHEVPETEEKGFWYVFWKMLLYMLIAFLIALLIIFLIYGKIFITDEKPKNQTKWQSTIYSQLS